MKKPFFEKFLENQVKNEEAGAVQGGETDKLADTDKLQDQYQTHKYPSDHEDGTKPVNDMYQTHKYPSDGDDDLGAL